LKTPIGLVRQIAIVDDAPHLRAWVRAILREHPQLNLLVETTMQKLLRRFLRGEGPTPLLLFWMMHRNAV